jgi:hypothetical protein
VAAALVAALILPGSALAARGMEVALQDDTVFVQRVSYDYAKALGKAVQMRVTRIRANISWDVALGRQARFRKRPKHIRYDFSRWDFLIDAAAERGIKLQLVLTGMAPRWATSNHKVGPMRPNPKLFGHFARAAAEHFKGRIDRYSIWNEPNHRGWLAPLKSQASQYRRLYRRGYAAIKKADPAAQVLIGETAPYASNPKNAQPPLKFLRALTCVNRRYHSVRSCKLYADGFAHHPYEYHRPPDKKFPGRDNVTMSGLHKLTRALDKLKRARALRTPGGKALDLYLTEFGYFARGRQAISDKKRAKYTVQAYEMAVRNPRVHQMLYYLLVRPGPVHAFFDTSLLGRKGQPSRPYRKLVAWASKAARKGRIAKPVPPSSGPSGQPPGGEQPPPPPPGPACAVPLPPGVPCPTP